MEGNRKEMHTKEPSDLKNYGIDFEPKLSDEVKWALHAKTSGIVSPYEMTIALCENANTNAANKKANVQIAELFCFFLPLTL